MAEKIVITRHPALVELLKERGIIAGDELILEHVGAGDVVGKDVIGNIPLNLAALAKSVTEIPLRLTPELRGKELDLETLRQIAGEAMTYRVEKIK